MITDERFVFAGVGLLFSPIYAVKQRLHFTKLLGPIFSQCSSFISMHSFSYRTTFPTIFCYWARRFAAVEHTDTFAGKGCFPTLQFAAF